jgi:hypothetical protein
MIFCHSEGIIGDSFRDEDWISDCPGQVFDMGGKDQRVPGEIGREIPTVQETSFLSLIPGPPKKDLVTSPVELDPATSIKTLLRSYYTVELFAFACSSCA